MKLFTTIIVLFLVSSNIYAQEKKIELKLDLYPNPATDFVIIESNSNNINDFDFQLHSIIGNKVNVSKDIISNRKIRFSVKYTTFTQKSIFQ